MTIEHDTGPFPIPHPHPSLDTHFPPLPMRGLSNRPLCEGDGADGERRARWVRVEREERMGGMRRKRERAQHTMIKVRKEEEEEEEEEETRTIRSQERAHPQQASMKIHQKSTHENPSELHALKRRI